MRYSSIWIIQNKGTKRKEGGGTLIVPLVFKVLNFKMRKYDWYKRETILQIFEISSTF